MLIFNSSFRKSAISAGLALSLFLSGCANQKMHNEGLDLVQEGHIEEGLQKLKKASNAEPDNVPYRNDYRRTKSESIYTLLAEATSELGKGNVDAATKAYKRILTIEPENPNAIRGLETIAMNQRHAVILDKARELIKKGDLEEARGEIEPVLVENPKSPEAGALIREIDEQEAKTQTAEPVLTGKFKKPVSMQFKDANLKMVLEALSRISGINILLDKDIRSDIKTSIFVHNVSVANAIDLILMQSQLEKKVLSDNTLYIYPNTPSKIKELQDLKVRSFHLTYADPKNMMSMLKSLLKVKDVVVNDATSSLIMRDTPQAIKLAEKFIADQDVAQPEVMLEVEVLEVTRARMHDLGLQYPTQETLTPLPNTVTAAATATAAASTAVTLGSLRNITNDSIVVSPTPSITLNAMLQDSDTNILSSPRLRVKNREKAKIMIGQRVPIITNSVTPVTGGSGSVVTGTVSYQDVGLKFDVEPIIHLDNEVTIKLGLEVSSLGQAVTTASGSSVYIVGTRNTSTTLRLHDGETQILAGLITDTDTSTVDKVPLLGQVPLLGHLFANDNGQKSKTEIILSITPHIVGNKKIPDAREMEYWSGTDSQLRSDQLVLKSYGEVSLTGEGHSHTDVSQPEAASAPAAAAPAENAPAAPSSTAIPAGAPAIPGAAIPAAKPDMSQAGSGVAAAATLASVAAPAPIKFSWDGPIRAKVGDKITLSLNTMSLQGVKALDFDVGFDPSVFKAVDVKAGNAMSNNAAAPELSKTIDQVGGTIKVGLNGNGSKTGGGVVTVTFEVLAPVTGTSVTMDGISATMESGESQTPEEPSPMSITTEK